MKISVTWEYFYQIVMPETINEGGATKWNRKSQLSSWERVTFLPSWSSVRIKICNKMDTQTRVRERIVLTSLTRIRIK